MRTHPYYSTILVCIALSLIWCTSASFAQTQTLTIQDGRVLVNGKELTEDQIPSSLNVERLNVQLQFTGSAIELNGHYYAIEDQTLREVHPLDLPQNETTVIFRSEFNEADDLGPTRQDGALSRSREPLPLAPSAAGDEAVEQNTLMQQYVFEVAQRDQALYQQLITELELERETREIALRVRQLPPGEEREEQIAHLRALLGRILDLKQDNRRREIAQLEEQLSILQDRLVRREAMKEQMIDRRIEELLGTAR